MLNFELQFQVIILNFRFEFEFWIWFWISILQLKLNSNFEFEYQTWIQKFNFVFETRIFIMYFEFENFYWKIFIFRICFSFCRDTYSRSTRGPGQLFDFWDELRILFQKKHVLCRRMYTTIIWSPWSECQAHCLDYPETVCIFVFYWPWMSFFGFWALRAIRWLNCVKMSD